MGVIKLPDGLFRDVSSYLPKPLRGEERVKFLLGAIFYVVWGGGDWCNVDESRFGCCGEDARRLYRLLRDFGVWGRIEGVVLSEMNRGRFRNWAA